MLRDGSVTSLEAMPISSATLGRGDGSTANGVVGMIVEQVAVVEEVRKKLVPDPDLAREATKRAQAFRRSSATGRTGACRPMTGGGSSLVLHACDRAMTREHPGVVGGEAAVPHSASRCCLDEQVSTAQARARVVPVGRERE